MSIIASIYSAAIGIDETLAALAFNGQSDITISSRCGMALIDIQSGNPPPMSGTEAWLLHHLALVLDDIQKEHCYQALQGDFDRAGAVRAQIQPYLSKIPK